MAESNFIHNIIDKDLETQKYGDKVHTRFPPEPNGYLHIGHAKSICLNFSTAEKYGGQCNLRYDDTNPVKEDVEYVDSIEEDVKWLGFQWDNRLWASDYFDEMYDCAAKSHQEGQSLRLRPERGRDPCISRHAQGAGKGKPVQKPQRGRKPEIIRRDEGRQVRRRRDGASGENRYGFSEYESERSGASTVSLTSEPSQYRRRSGASIRCTTSLILSKTPSKGDSFYLHAGIRRSQTALRLGPSGNSRQVGSSATADRICASEPDQYRS